MKKLIALMLLLVSTCANASIVTVDFEEFAPVNVFQVLPDSPFNVEPRFEVSYTAGVILWQTTGIGNESSAVQIAHFGLDETITLRDRQGFEFDLLSMDFFFADIHSENSFDILAEKGDGSVVNLTVNGTLEGRGVWENVSLPSSLEDVVSVTFVGNTAAIQYDNIVVNAVPIPAAVWLFGSALAGLGWLRRRQTA
jgi:hypothetical protein